MNVKQVIVMRSDLKNYDGLKIRKEKPHVLLVVY